MAVCWITGQLCYNGIRAVRNREGNPCLEEFWVNLCCGHPDVLHESRDKVIGKQWSELDGSLQCRRNQVREEITWVDKGADSCKEVRMIMTRDSEEVDDDLVSQDYMPGQRGRVQEA